MSHYSVAVVTRKKPTEDILSEMLKPYEEDLVVCPYVYETKEKFLKNKRIEYENYKTKGPYSRYIEDPVKYEEECSNSSHIEYVKNFMNEYNKSDETLLKERKESLPSELDDNLEYGCRYLDKDGNEIAYYNKNAKWDWYVIGGRWENMLRTKQGELVNSCTLGELDFETQIKELTKKAHEIYDTFEKCLGDLPKNWMSWKDVLADQQFNTIEERRNFYHNQVQIKAIKANDTNNLFWAFGYDIDSFMVDRETYVSLYAGKPFSTYAVLDATEDSDIGTWHGSDIGMWGITLREEENWEEKNQRLLRSFPSDYVITIVDCHI